MATSKLFARSEQFAMMARLKEVPAYAFFLATALVLSGCSGSPSASVGEFADSGQLIGSNSLVPPAGPLDPSRTLEARFVTVGKSYYKLGATDVLKVTVFQVDELNRTVQVSGRGTITLPLIGEVRAAGRTAQEVEAEVAARLRAKYMNSPQVTVYIEEYNSQKITVGGAVKKPGIYPVKGDLSLLQAIASAEGFDAVADPSNVMIFRQDAGQKYAGRFNVDHIRSGAAQDPLLQNGDVVVVDNSGMRTMLRDWSPAFGAVSSTAAFVGVVK